MVHSGAAASEFNARSRLLSRIKLPRNMRSIVERALDEDGARSDVTTNYLRLAGTPICADLVAGADGVVAGMRVARAAFVLLDEAVEFDARVGDGDRIHPGDILAQVRGDAGAVLSAERVALNFLQRLSGIATLTARFVERVEGTGVTILDTRKTTPLLRPLERYAVVVGGGRNHRFNLSDMLLIKENHLRSVDGLASVAARLAEGRPAQRVEVEIDSLEALGPALDLGVDRIMLDNFAPADVEKAVARIGHRGRVEIEVSGGITLDNVAAYALPGVDFISVGALTHGASWLDVSLEVRPSQ